MGSATVADSKPDTETKSPKTKPTKALKTEKKIESKKPITTSPAKKSWFGSLFGSSTKQPSYHGSKVEKYIDPKTGEEKVRYNTDIDQYTQVKQTWCEETQRWIFDDGEAADDESSDDDALPTLKKRTKPKPQPKVQSEEKEDVK